MAYSDIKNKEKPPKQRYILLAIIATFAYSASFLLSYILSEAVDSDIFGSVYTVFGGLITLIVFFEYQLIRKESLEKKDD